MATVVPAASLPLPRRASAAARRPAAPSLHKRHCAVPRSLLHRIAMNTAMFTTSLSLQGRPSQARTKRLASPFLGAPASFLWSLAPAPTAAPSRRTLAVRAMAPPKPGGKPKKGIEKCSKEPQREKVGKARRPAAPSLRKRHCAVSPVAAACSTPPPRQLDNDAEEEESSGRRQVLVAGAATAATFLSRPNGAAFAAEAMKGFLPVIDKKTGYSFLYPFGWEEVVVQGQDKVYKDVIEPLESVSINTISTSKESIRELGPPDKVAETLVKKVLAPPNQKTKLIEAKENEVDGRAYYTFEFTAQAPNYTRHALGAVAIGNGKFYTLTTGANERRWDKMKDRLHTVIDSFRIENRI